MNLKKQFLLANFSFTTFWFKSTRFKSICSFTLIKIQVIKYQIDTMKWLHYPPNVFKCHLSCLPVFSAKIYFIQDRWWLFLKAGIWGSFPHLFDKFCFSLMPCPSLGSVSVLGVTVPCLLSLLDFCLSPYQLQDSFLIADFPGKREGTTRLLALRGSADRGRVATYHLPWGSVDNYTLFGRNFKKKNLYFLKVVASHVR